MKTFIKITFFLTMFLTSSLLYAQYTAGGNNSASATACTFVGYNSGKVNTGTVNSFFGRNAGMENTTGGGNVFMGYNTGAFNKTGSFNTFVGLGAGVNNKSGNNNVFLGYAAGNFNSTGYSNSFMGFRAGYFNTTGIKNTLVGYHAGYNNRTGNYNVFMGIEAGYSNTTANGNSFLGFTAGRNTTTGGLNTFLGSQAGYSNKTGVGNTLLGNRAGFKATGNYNVFIGNKAGENETGSNKLYIDNSSTSAPLIKGDFSANTLTFNGKVGIGTSNTGSYKLYVSGSAYSTGNWTSSDKRYKKNIKTIDSALEKINALNGVTYNFKQKVVNDINFSKVEQGNQIGFIAQELEKVFPELVRKDEAGYYAVNYDGLIPVLVEAVKEQQDVIDEQEEEMIEQKEEITDLRTRLEKLEALLNTTEDVQGSTIPTNENSDIRGVVLRQNAPNPLSDRTTIEYQLPDNLKTASLTVFDLNGKSIATYNIAGKGFVEFDASGLPNGTYAYAIVANGRSIASQKMVIQR